MPTVFDLAEKYRISARKLRRMHKDGHLRCDGAGDPIADEIRVMLNSSQTLSVKHLLALLQSPGLILEIGNRQDEAQAQLKALGDPEPAPDDIWPELVGAAVGDPDAIAKLVAWAQATIPKQGKVGHHYLAVRLMLAVPEGLQKHEIARLNRVFYHLRKAPEFAGWWHVEQQGKRRVTWYHQPEGFDL